MAEVLCVYREVKLHGFDGEKQGSAVRRIFDELGALHIEALGQLILGVGEHRPDADALQGNLDTAQGVRKHIGVKSAARIVMADR